MEGKKYMYQGLTVYESGTVIDTRGLVRLPLPNGKIGYMLNGKRHFMNFDRFIYEAISGEKLSKSEKVIHKDGNDKNCCYENLTIQKREGNKKRKVSIELEEQIRKEYNLEERKKHNFMGIYAKPTYKDLEKKYNLCITTLYKIINKKYS